MDNEGDDKVLTLQMAIEEQRRVYDWLCNNYGQIRTKTLTFLAGGLAVLTFLYANGETFIPDVVYGKIFYFTGLSLVIGSLGILFYALKTVKWEFPTEKVKLEPLDFGSYLEYLEYVKTRYNICYDINVKLCETKHRLLEVAFYPLVFGAIILVVLNIFEG